MTDEVQKALLHKESARVIDLTAQKSGMLSMQIDGAIKALRGLTTIDEVVRVTNHDS